MTSVSEASQAMSASEGSLASDHSQSRLASVCQPVMYEPLDAADRLCMGGIAVPLDTFEGDANRKYIKLSIHSLRYWLLKPLLQKRSNLPAACVIDDLREAIKAWAR